MTSKSTALLVLLTASLLGCSTEKSAPTAKDAAPAPPPQWTLSPQALQAPVADGASSAPQLSVSREGVPLLSWLEVADDKAVLKFAERNANGWSEPKTVASGTDWFINDSDVPSVIRMSNGTLAANWLQN